MQDVGISFANSGFLRATYWAKIFFDCAALGCCSAVPGLAMRILWAPFASLLTFGCASLLLHAHPCLPSFRSPTCKRNSSLRVRRLRQQGIHLLAYHLIFVSCAQVFAQGARAVRCVSSRFTCYRACRWPWSLSYESGISAGMPQPHSCAHFWNESPVDTGWTSSHRGPHTQASKPRRAIEENLKNGSKHGPSFWTGIRSRFRDRAFALLFDS